MLVKGKPSERVGRKATDLKPGGEMGKVAGLPGEIVCRREMLRGGRGWHFLLSASRSDFDVSQGRCQLVSFIFS